MVWSVTAVLLVVLVAATSIGFTRGEALDRVVVLQLAGTLAPLVAIVAAIASGRGVYLEVALALALVTLAGSLVYARFLERWL